MSGILSHPNLTHDLQRELAIAASKDSEVNAKANPALAWVSANNANALLLKSFAQCTHFKPTPGVEKRPSHWTSPPPGGASHCVALVIGIDGKGKLRACASNAVAKPSKMGEPSPPKFFEQFDAVRSNAAQVKLLHQAVSSAASTEYMDWVERVFNEGQRYRASPVFLVVLDGNKQHFYATTALVEGPEQTDGSLEWTGRVAT